MLAPSRASGELLPEYVQSTPALVETRGTLSRWDSRASVNQTQTLCRPRDVCSSLLAACGGSCDAQTVCVSCQSGLCQVPKCASV